MAANQLLSELFASTRSRIRWLLGQHSDLEPMAAEHAGSTAPCSTGTVRAAVLAEAHLVTSRRAALEHRAAPAHAATAWKG